MKKPAHLIYALFMIFILGGCASAPVTSKSSNSYSKTASVVGNAEDPAKSESEVMEGAISQADKAYKANRPDEATAILNEVATTYPQSKSPWKRMAQADFDAENYGKAIVEALEVLKRDPKDQNASSIVVVSGLRLSTKSLTDLRSQNEISGSLKTEATELAKIISENLGVPVLVAKQRKPVYRKRKYQAESDANEPKPTSSSKSADLANPFGVLK